MVLGPISFVAVGYIRTRDYQKAVVPEAEYVIPKEKHIFTTKARERAVVREVCVQRPFQVPRVGVKAWKDLAASLLCMPEILAEHKVNNVEMSIETIMLAVVDELRLASRIQEDRIDCASATRASTVCGSWGPRRPAAIAQNLAKTVLLHGFRGRALELGSGWCRPLG